MALFSGSPLRSTRSTVEEVAAKDIPSMRAGSIATFCRQTRAASQMQRHQSEGSCSAQPGLGKLVAYGALAVAKRLPSRVQTPTRALCVPTSIPRNKELDFSSIGERTLTCAQALEDDSAKEKYSHDHLPKISH